MNHCLLALAKMYSGRRTRETRVSQEGLGLYGQALRMLNNALENNNHCITTELIVSVVSLGLAEVRTSLFPPAIHPQLCQQNITEHDAVQQNFVAGPHSWPRTSVCNPRASDRAK